MHQLARMHRNAGLPGLKLHGSPCRLASNSTVIVRLVSTWVLRTGSSGLSRLLMPVTSQNFWYIGTMA
jgi:hypothetical protein